MSDIDTAHLRTLAEKAIWYDDPTDWPTPDAVGFADDDSNNYVSALSPQTVLALLDELEQARQQIDNQEHNVRTAMQDRREVINAAKKAHDVLMSSRYVGKAKVAARILRPYIKEPDND